MHDEPDRTDPTIMGNDVPRHDEHEKDHKSTDHHHAGSHEHRTEEVIGEAAGGLSGVIAGAAIGSLGGPIGVVVGGLAGAVGGWWAGKAIADATADLDLSDKYYRERFESDAARPAGRRYEDVRPAYQLGDLASRNPDYVGREFADVEMELQQGWTGETADRFGEWAGVRDYARDAYNRRRVETERPISTADERGVHLSEAVDPTALGDGTSVTGYASGLEDEPPPRDRA
jgi:hypothetical protein